MATDTKTSPPGSQSIPAAIPITAGKPKPLEDETPSLLEIGRRAAMRAEREAIERTLLQTRWNRRQAARILKISYKALLNKLKTFEAAGRQEQEPVRLRVAREGLPGAPTGKPEAPRNAILPTALIQYSGDAYTSFDRAETSRQPKAHKVLPFLQAKEVSATVLSQLPPGDCLYVCFLYRGSAQHSSP